MRKVEVSCEEVKGTCQIEVCEQVEVLCDQEEGTSEEVEVWTRWVEIHTCSPMIWL